jgi:predicted alpha/beta-hydrolase family hydrolase
MRRAQSEETLEEFPVTGTAARVSGLWLRRPGSRFLYVMAHGAGAGMRHPFLAALAHRLADAGVATFRYQFPYMEEGRRRPDPAHLLEASVRSAVELAAARAAPLPIVAGGKSMGGRMTSAAVARGSLQAVAGLVFLGFPLHPPGRPGVERAQHLPGVRVPMLFLQGTRDDFAQLDLLTPLCQRLGAGTTLHLVEGADHSFHVPKRSRRSEEDVLDELAVAISAWATRALRLEGR